jgi:hypothetical protein
MRNAECEIRVRSIAGQSPLPKKRRHRQARIAYLELNDLRLRTLRFP